MEQLNANTAEQNRQILLELLHSLLGLIRLLTERNIIVFRPATHRAMDLLVSVFVWVVIRELRYHRAACDHLRSILKIVYSPIHPVRKLC